MRTRRSLLQSAALITGVTPALIGEIQEAQRAESLSQAAPPAALQVPKMRFGPVEISRMIVGCNPFYGFAHFNNTLSMVMREYYTSERVCQVLHQCRSFGINAYNYVNRGRAAEDWARFQSQGGQLHLIVQGIGDPVPLCRTLKPLAIYYHGEQTDRAYQNRAMSDVREWCRKVRDQGVIVGVGTHKPEVIALAEEQGWDVDFYAGCIYNRTRTETEWKQVLNGELLEMPAEIYLRSDPPRMYRVMRQTRKPCFAFKILAAGRIAQEEVDQAFRTAFESIKPIDGIFVGMFPLAKDEVRENAGRVRRILTGG